jgi:hypothetical protein
MTFLSKLRTWLLGPPPQSNDADPPLRG